MRRILVIDDNDDLRELMQVILHTEGFEVEVASNGQAGIAAHRRQPFHLIVTDIFMPNQDGIETIMLLRQDFPDVKIVAVSGGGKSTTSQGYLMTALEIGADAALAKPFEPETLRTTVRRLLTPPAR